MRAASLKEILHGCDLNGYRLETWYEVDPQNLYSGKAFLKDRELAQIYTEQMHLEGPYAILVLTKDGVNGLLLTTRDVAESDSDGIRRDLLSRARARAAKVSGAQALVDRLNRLPAT